jgi:cytoskeletal protein CcmA (bactofilin family)
LYDRDGYRVTGIGYVKSGKYRTLSVEGVGIAFGPLDVQTHTSSGTLVMRGLLSGESLSFFGYSYIQGSLSGTNLFVCGKMRVAGGVKAESLSLEGKLICRNEMNSRSFRSKGTFLGKSLHTTEADLHGKVRLRELDGQKIRITAKKKSYIQSVTGDSLHLTGADNSSPSILTAENVVGKDIDIENCQIHFLKGDVLNVGPRCRVEIVQYVNQLTVHPTSVVKVVYQYDEGADQDP